MKNSGVQELMGVVQYSTPNPAMFSEFALVTRDRRETIAYLEESTEEQGIDLASLVGERVSIDGYIVDTSEDTGEVPLICVSKDNVHVLSRGIFLR
jgi:hypothetical protein